LLSEVLTAGYLFPIVARAFFRPPPADAPAAPGGLRGEASALMVVPLAVTALLGLVLGLGDAFSIFDLASTDASLVIGASP
jgi:NADH:ubiquinone oxidoreductase subunit 5 (subunit L)/multisubunit Na+/H+ antiporter MnhA subunit